MQMQMQILSEQQFRSFVEQKCPPEIVQSPFGPRNLNK